MKMDAVLKWLLGGAGAVILLGFANYIIGQEVTKQMKPIEQEYRAFSATVSQMQFEERNTEVTEERDKCLADGHAVEYCDAVAAWRWDVWYPYLECIAPIKEYKDREPACGPAPEKLRDPEPPGDTPPE